jgi:hypothetical protein
MEIKLIDFVNFRILGFYEPLELLPKRTWQWGQAKVNKVYEKKFPLEK